MPGVYMACSEVFRVYLVSSSASCPISHVVVPPHFAYLPKTVLILTRAFRDAVALLCVITWRIVAWCP